MTNAARQLRQLLERRAVEVRRGTIFDALAPYMEDPDIFISFRDLEKPGINPKSRFDTPLGVYAYPLTLLVEQGDEPGSVVLDLDDVPYASERPYVHVLRRNTAVRYLPDLDQMSGATLKRVRLLLLDDAGARREIEAETGSKRDPELIQMEEVLDRWEGEAKNGTPGGRFWNLTRRAAGKNPAQWNRILRVVCGFESICDLGAGIIHDHEPYQAVFLSSRGFSLVAIERNIRQRGAALTFERYRALLQNDPSLSSEDRRSLVTAFFRESLDQAPSQGQDPHKSRAKQGLAFLIRACRASTSTRMTVWDVLAAEGGDLLAPLSMVKLLREGGFRPEDIRDLIPRAGARALVGPHLADNRRAIVVWVKDLGLKNDPELAAAILVRFLDEQSDRVPPVYLMELGHLLAASLPETSKLQHPTVLSAVLRLCRAVLRTMPKPGTGEQVALLYGSRLDPQGEILLPRVFQFLLTEAFPPAVVIAFLWTWVLAAGSKDASSARVQAAVTEYLQQQAEKSPFPQLVQAVLLPFLRYEYSEGKISTIYQAVAELVRGMWERGKIAGTGENARALWALDGAMHAVGDVGEREIVSAVYAAFAERFGREGENAVERKEQPYEHGRDQSETSAVARGGRV